MPTFGRKSRNISEFGRTKSNTFFWIERVQTFQKAEEKVETNRHLVDKVETYQFLVKTVAKKIDHFGPERSWNLFGYYTKK